MDIVLTPTKLNGTIDARPSLTCVCLHEIAQDLAGAQPGENSPRNRDLSPADAKATPAAPRDFCGQTDLWSPLLEKVRDCFQRLSEPDGMPNCGNDPSALALLLPIASVLKDRVSFIGEKGCPRDILPAAQEALGRFGPSFSCGSLKLRRRDRKKFEEICTLSGRLTYGHISLTGKEDPWFVTGLLFALPLLEGNSTLRMTTLPESTALAEMAVDVLRQYDVTVNFNVDENGYPSFDIPGNQRYRIPGEIAIEGDWSRAAFWLCCGALGGNVTVRGLSADSLQPSRQILDKLHAMGAASGIGESSANVTAATLRGCNINASRIPDLVPVLAVALASASGPSMLTDAAGADLDAVCGVLTRLGADVTIDGSGLTINGKPFFAGGEIIPEDDPLAVLVAAEASCVCGEPVLIRDAGIINKYSPGFFDDFAALGGRIRVL